MVFKVRVDSRRQLGEVKVRISSLFLGVFLFVSGLLAQHFEKPAFALPYGQYGQREMGSRAQSQEKGINWIPTFKQGMEAARSLNRPILLVSAAPHCGNISGMW